MSDTQNTNSGEAKKTSVKKHKIDYLIFFFFGAVALLVLGAVAIIDCPNDAQLRFFQIILAISVGGLVAGVPGFLDVTYKDWIRAGGGLAAFVLILLLKPLSMATSPNCRSFDLLVNIETPGNDFQAIDNARVILRIGPHEMGPKVIHDSKLVFDRVPREYFADSIWLIPIDKGWKVVSQSHVKAEESTEIRFTISKVVDSTSVSGYVFDSKRRAVENAQLVFGTKFKVVTDKSGFYTIKLPYELGEAVRLLVLVNNAKVEDRKQYISESIDVIVPD